VEFLASEAEHAEGAGGEEYECRRFGCGSCFRSDVRMSLPTWKVPVRKVGSAVVPE